MSENLIIPNAENNVDIHKLSLEFLVCCYFGRSNDLLRASIDKAYIDMAAHTLEGFENNTEKKWSRRYNASNTIFKSIRNYKTDNYQQWHLKTIRRMRRCYDNPILSEGQAQKWLNMTVKYIFILKVLLGIDHPELIDAKTFLERTNKNIYYPPIDSYILCGSGNLNNSFNPWSGIKTEETYNNLKKCMDENNYNFIWELENWEKFRNEYGGIPNCQSYARYLEDNNLKYG